MAKIEIISGNKTEHPNGRNTIIKIDGKEISFLINHFSFEVETEGIAYYSMSLKKKPYWVNKIKYFTRVVKWKFKRLLKW